MSAPSSRTREISAFWGEVRSWQVKRSESTAPQSGRRSRVGTKITRLCLSPDIPLNSTPLVCLIRFPCTVRRYTCMVSADIAYILTMPPAIVPDFRLSSCTLDPPRWVSAGPNSAPSSYRPITVDLPYACRRGVSTSHLPSNLSLRPDRMTTGMQLPDMAPRHSSPLSSPIYLLCFL